MGDILILYGTSEGHTAKVAKHLAQLARLRDYSVALREVKELTPDFKLESYQAVVIGASIHAGKYQSEVKDFIEHNSASLKHIPSAFFSVCLTAAQTGEQTKLQVSQYIKQLLDDTNWQPLKIGSFSGALLYTQYGFFKRYLMKMMAKKNGGDTDTSRDYVYTDWNGVEQFMDEFLTSLESVKVDLIVNS